MSSIQKQMLTLYRQYFKVTQVCTDRHLRSYVRRRIRQQYEKNKNVSLIELQDFMKQAKQQLQVVKRQVKIRNLYT